MAGVCLPAAAALGVGSLSGARFPDSLATMVEVETIGPAPLDPRAQQHMVPMRDGVHLATDVYLPDGPGRSRRCSCACPTTRTAATAGCRSSPRTSSPAATRSCPRTCAASSGRRASRSPSSTRCPTATTRSNGSCGNRGRTAMSACGATATTASRNGPRSPRGHPALKAIVPRVTIADIDGGWTASPRSTALTTLGVLDRPPRTIGRPTGAIGRWPRSSTPAFEVIGRRSASFDYVLARSRGAARVPLYPGVHPFDVLRVPTLHGVGWFDSSRRRTCSITRRSCGTPATAPFQYLHAGSTDHENYQFEAAPFPSRPTMPRDDDALERMLPRYLWPALDFFDAFLTGRSDPAGVPRVRWHLAQGGWRDSPSWPPPGASELRLYLAGARSTPRAGWTEWPRITWVHDPENLVPSTLVDPFAALSTIRTNAPSRRGPTSDVHSAGAGRARHARRPRRRPPRGVERRALAVPPRQARRRPPRRPRPCAVVRPAGRGDPRRPAPAELYLGHTGYCVQPGHRLRLQVASSDFPVFLPHPGTAENPWDATATRTNRQTLATGGEPPSHVSLTTLAGR